MAASIMRVARSPRDSLAPRFRFLVAVSACFWADAAYSASYICKIVNNEWQEFSFHVVGSIDYVAVGQRGKAYELGTGVYLFGRPRGERKSGHDVTKITAIGFGALYARSKDSTQFKVCITSEGVSPITIIDKEF
ncbi:MULTISPECIES: hypothetical protein [Mesorhizobium]|uniref:hypothetical protein n=1 Tax=Mesorhizobium TaxID=68287 RepID=UPI0010A95488|nr:MULTISPECIES: hypothetical protein [Mesorhizobium]